jgi:UPF0755 protein
MIPPPDPASHQKSPHLIVGVSVLIALLIGGTWFFYLRRPATAVSFTVARGDSARLIARHLSEQKRVIRPWSFLFWVKVLGKGSAIRPGVYTLASRDGGLAIYEKLRQGPPLVRVTFPEGWTAGQMAALLDAQGVTPAREFLAWVDKEKSEGTLFPDTYFFDQGLAPEVVIHRLRDRFNAMKPSDFASCAKALKLSDRQLVTLASIVERETRVASERPIVAGIFLNRLRKRWYLESCATVEYALGARKPRLTYKDLQVLSPYNTYRHLGLPPGPICNPGAASLEAAAHPAKTDLMFFVLDAKGTHQFSRYYKEHLAVQKKKRRR